MTGAPGAPAASTSTWVLRVNPLPRRRLADSAQAQWLGRLVALDSELTALSQQCSEELYERIGGAPPEQKKALLAVRRSIHNGRVPTAVPNGIGAAASRWIELARARDSLITTIEQELEAALARERAALAECLGDPDFQQALALVAPEVHAAAIRYREGARTSGGLPNSARKSERGFLQYLTRAMARTSPLSRFTAVGLGRLDAAGAPLDQVDFQGATPFVGLDQVMFNYVAGGLVAGQREPDAEFVQQSPLLRMDPEGGKVLFSREVDGKVRVRALPLTVRVLLVIELTSLGPRRFADVASDLRERIGESAQSAAALLHLLLDAGLLCVAPGAREVVASPIRELAARVGPPQADLLHGLADRLAQFGSAPADTRREALDDIAAIATSLSHAARRPAFLQVDEDYMLSPLTVSTKGHEEPLRDLAAMIGFMSVFDRLHDFRAIASATFADQFGAGAVVPLVANAKALMTEVYRRVAQLTQESAGEFGPPDGSLAELHRQRRLLSEWVLAHYRAHAGDGEVTLPAADLAAAAAGVPARFRAIPLSYGVFVQPWRDTLVYNDALAGHGILFGRFLGADHGLGGRARERLARRVLATYGADGVRVAEDRGLHRLNVNARPPALDDQLSPDDWFDLRLAHDRDTDQLWILDPDGRRTRVLTFGTGHPEFYPAPLRIANWLVSCSRVVVPFAGTLYRESSDGTGATWSCPRLRAGSVVMSRRRWHGHDEFDAAVETRGEAERLTALARWRAAHDVPEEIMVKTTSTWRPGQPAGDRASAPSRRDKPQYIDLSSSLFARVLPRLIERRRDGYIEEAIPGLSDSPHVFEWVVEANRPPFGDFTIEEA